MVRPLRRWPCPALLGLALASLLAGLLLSPPRVPLAGRVAVDMVHSHFGPLLGAALVCAGAALGPGRSGLAVGTRAVALGVLAAGALALAALAAALVQGFRGDAPVDATAYGLGIFPGLGMHLAHLAALALFGQALRRGWAGAAATAAVYVAVAVVPSASGIDHPLLRLGGPLVPWSDMAGFGPFLAPWVAAAIAWSAISVLLLVAAGLLPAPRPRRGHWVRLRTTASVAWAAAVLGAVAGGWLLANDREAPAAGLFQTVAEPQPRYARLTLDLEIYPYRRRVDVRGVAILAQEANAPTRELRLALPAGLALATVEVTGERLPSPPRTMRFRLNRPLEPGERLRLAFAGVLAAERLPRLTGRPRLLANGTAFALADVTPVLGDAATEQHARLQARIGTSVEQTAVAPGEILGRWKEEGRSYVELRTPQTVPLAATVHSGRYQRLGSQDAAVVAFVHNDHRQFGEALLARIEAAHQAIATPLRGQLRLVEVPDFRRTFSAPRSPGLSLSARAAGGVLPVSELELLANTPLAP